MKFWNKKCLWLDNMKISTISIKIWNQKKKKKIIKIYKQIMRKKIKTCHDKWVNWSHLVGIHKYYLTWLAISLLLTDLSICHLCIFKRVTIIYYMNVYFHFTNIITVISSSLYKFCVKWNIKNHLFKNFVRISICLFLTMMMTLNEMDICFSLFCLSTYSIQLRSSFFV